MRRPSPLLKPYIPRWVYVFTTVCLAQILLVLVLQTNTDNRHPYPVLPHIHKRAAPLCEQTQRVGRACVSEADNTSVFLCSVCGQTTYCVVSEAVVIRSEKLIVAHAKCSTNENSRNSLTEMFHSMTLSSLFDRGHTQGVEEKDLAMLVVGDPHTSARDVGADSTTDAQRVCPGNALLSQLSALFARHLVVSADTLSSPAVSDTTQCECVCAIVFVACLRACSLETRFNCNNASVQQS